MASENSQARGRGLGWNSDSAIHDLGLDSFFSGPDSQVPSSFSIACFMIGSQEVSSFSPLDLLYLKAAHTLWLEMNLAWEASCPRAPISKPWDTVGACRRRRRKGKVR